MLQKKDVYLSGKSRKNINKKTHMHHILRVNWRICLGTKSTGRQSKADRIQKGKELIRNVQ